MSKHLETDLNYLEQQILTQSSMVEEMIDKAYRGLREMRDDFLAVSPTSRKVGEETVRVARLDSVFDDHVGAGDRAFLKIDTQGSEAEVIVGAAASMARIAGLQLELSLVPLYQGEADYRSLLDRVHGLGFAPYLIIPGYWSRHLGRMVQFDGIFFRCS